MNSIGDHPKVTTSRAGRDLVSGTTTPGRLDRERGTWMRTRSKRPGSGTPRAAHCSRASGRLANLALGRSRWSRSSPLTLNTSARVCGAAAPSSRRPAAVSNSM